MIVVRLCGGLGNQLFQYALGRVLAIKNGTSLFFDSSAFRTSGQNGDTQRQYRLAFFHIKGAPLPSFMSPLLLPFPRHLPRRMRWIPHWPGLVRRITEEGHGFNQEILKTGAPAYLDGYWQSHKYHEAFSAEIRADLELVNPMTSARQNFLGQIEREKNAVSVHVRRGDYVSNPQANAFHGLCSVDYYTKAVALMQEQVSLPRFFVFSDDPSWVREKLSVPKDSVFIDPQADEREYEDLHLMAKCRHHIIANSSFSWWGAWLNPFPEKKVIAPAQWFVGAASTEDRLPSSWTRI